MGSKRKAIGIYEISDNSNDDQIVQSEACSGGMMSLTVPNERGANTDITYDAPPPCDRGQWSAKLDFILTCVGYAVGLGNVWRFPYLCYKNGGGAFLIPYATMFFFLGLPLFFLELAFGQFASLGPISVWFICPLFKGIGYAMTFISAILVIYYQVVVAQTLRYLIASFTAVLPWSNCGTFQSSSKCLDSTNISNSGSWEGYISPSEDYYYNNVLQITKGIEEFGKPSWQLALCLLACWVVSALAVIRGVQTLGKVSYFTSTFPYLMLTILLIRSSLLPGALEGVIFYLTPDFTRLRDPRVWVEAATQIFFSLGAGNGGLIAMSSYNPFKNNCCRDAVIVAVLNCGTSVYAGVVVFSNLGYMAHIKNVTVGDVAKSGPGLAFVVYPEAMTNMPLPSLWSILFFLMMLTLGFGSLFSILETVLSSIRDELRRFGYVFSTQREILYRSLLCFVNFLLGLPMICGGGYYLFYLIDNSVAGYPLLLIALCETIVICYIYGLKQFLRDVELMTNERPGWYWRICWLVATPTICLFLIIFLFVVGDEFTVDQYRYPKWALIIGNLIEATPLVIIVLWFVYKYCKEGGMILLLEYMKPVYEWGPAEKENRAEFLTMIKSSESLHKSRINDIVQPLNTASGLNLDGNQIQNFGSVISGLTGAMNPDKMEFFQSKLNVAEKLKQAHGKETSKQAISSSDFGSADGLVLSASQMALASSTVRLPTSILPQQQQHTLNNQNSENNNESCATDRQSERQQKPEESVDRN